MGGVVTFKNAKKLVQTVSELPLDKSFFETDCPYMAHGATSRHEE